MTALQRRLLALASLLLSANANADGLAIDRVYLPYVEALEKEIEWRSLYLGDDDNAIDGSLIQRLGVGRAFGETQFLEAYAITANRPGQGMDLEAWELEHRWQMTEQGEYSADWGLLTELEYETDEEVWELSSGVLISRDWGRFTGVVNLFGIFEWGEGIDSEFETSLAAQWRYRLRPSLEPAVELYSGEDTLALGPVLLGAVPLGERRQLQWQFGLLFGVDDATPDTIIRALLEFEF